MVRQGAEGVTAVVSGMARGGVIRLLLSAGQMFQKRFDDSEGPALDVVASIVLRDHLGRDPLSPSINSDASAEMPLRKSEGYLSLRFIAFRMPSATARSTASSTVSDWPDRPRRSTPGACRALTTFFRICPRGRDADGLPLPDQVCGWALKVVQTAMNMAATTGPVMNPCMPKVAIPPSVEISTT